MNRLLQRLGIMIIAVACFSALGYGQLYVDTDAAGNNDGSSWADAYVDLQDALAAALPDDEIWVAEGSYLPGTDTLDYFQLVEGVKLYGGFAGTEASRDERDPAANVTTLTGDVAGDDIPGDFANNRSDNVFHVILADSTITNATIVDGFTISGGTSLDPTRDGLPGIIRDSGGGIISTGSPVISNCIITGNFASRGGGIYVTGPDASSSKFLNCDISGNAARFGGAAMIIGVDGGLIDNCTFTGNSAAVSAAGLYNGGSIDTVMNSTFQQNTATFGTIFNDGSLGYYENLDISNNEAANLAAAVLLFGGESQFVNCDLNSNIAGSGGAVFGFAGLGIFTGCNFVTNAADAGAAAFVQGGGVEFNECVFEQNTGGNFGGAGLTGFGSATRHINCVFRENESTRFGAGWWIQNDSTSSEFTGCRFIENRIQGGSASFGNALAFGQGSFNSVDSCYFDGNNNGFTEDFGNGGAIWLSGDTIMTSNGNVITPTFNVTRSQFYSNQAGTQGGAIDISGTNANIVNNIFAFNMSNGGTIINNGSDRFGSFLNLTNNTFYFNVGELGSGLVQWENPGDTVEAVATATLQNNIFVSGDGGPAYMVEDGTPQIISNGGNHMQDESLDTAAVAEDVENVTEEDIAFVDPFSIDFNLSANSIAIDAGVNDGAPTVDLTGDVRLSAMNTIVDPGALEAPPTNANNLVSSFGIDISPTVTNDQVNVVFNSEVIGDVQVRVYDYQGRKVMHFDEEKGAETFRRTYSVGHLPSGTYIVRVLTEGEIGGGKFVIAQ